MSFIASIEQKLSVQETKVEIRIFGSVLVALSGIILFADKVTNFHFTNNYGFSDTQTFIWVFSQSISPLIITIANFFKPFKTAYLAPVYFYTIQVYWVFNPSVKFDDYFLQTYAIGVVLSMFLLGYIIRKINKIKSRKSKHQEEVLREIKNTISVLKKEVITKEAI
ncbi:hypothetical protein [Tenacibaculum maritimum]|uniref:hypothetical protein n=1 Tax=Tenacibaculum maritimum TaxID=107401 RepID=UPI0012E502B1|nr:hypothetical protein [Tenacibaculum maritimum]CAA0230362.1 membrane hypothetical protein [Tenacibaculum maritimum]CAA0249895.1 membrane hypothetical protein [Tenacibaculum maritimum]